MFLSSGTRVSVGSAGRRRDKLSEEAERTRDAILANLSHELRTPLNAIIGLSEMVLSEAFGPVENARYREYVGDIHNSGRVLLRLIDDLLEAAEKAAAERPNEP